MGFLRALGQGLMSFAAGVPKEGAVAFARLFRSISKFVQHLLRRLIDILQGKVRHEDGYYRIGCLEVPPDVARRPDPCLYSQRYLASQGLSVTWDNPDIVITNLDGTTAALPLDANRDYLVRGTIHNASFDPALGVAVRCFVRPWGVDFEDRVPVEVDADGFPATRVIHIGAWGQADAVFQWRTPNVDKGHYCVTVECYHPADREPANNVGQENTDVTRNVARGATVRVPIPFYNRQAKVRAFRVVADAYEIHEETVEFRLEQIRGPNGIAQDRRRSLLAAARSQVSVLEDPARLRRLVEWDAMRGARVRLSPKGRRIRRGMGYRLFGYHGADGLRSVHRAGGFPLPPGWKVDFPGQEDQAGQVVVPPRRTQDLEVAVTVPGDAPPGERRRINLTAFDAANRVVGGVTLDIQVSEVTDA